MKPQYHKLLSTFAFNFNLRRYNGAMRAQSLVNVAVTQLQEAGGGGGGGSLMVGRCRLTPG